MKPRFYTKYTLPERVLREYDSEDHVDRLSFCDTTLQIKRFMQAGYSLRLNRAQTLYHSVNDVYNDSAPIAPPVYVTDPVLADKSIKIVTSGLVKPEVSKEPNGSAQVPQASNKAVKESSPSQG